MPGLIEYVPIWKCLNCGEHGDARLFVPKKCPKCDSDKIEADPIKKSGPHAGPEKKY